MDSRAFFEKVGHICYNALIAEVTATPKPGLVDSANSGSHLDMDINTFKASANALRPFFVEFAKYGFETHSFPIYSILPVGREIGKQAEQAMLCATGGVNTHKGIIFSAGLICIAAGRLCGAGLPITVDSICKAVAQTVCGISDNDYSAKALESKEKLTNGEKIFKKYGLSGPRGEAESGFASVREYGLPFYRKCKQEGMSDNDAQVRTLLNLMSNIDDTNIINRGGIEASLYVKQKAATLINSSLQEIALFDLDLMGRNLSPGGCADLLSVTIILNELDCL